MSGYVQRYPFAPKAVWWKKYTDTVAMGERVIYRATDNTGFELDGIPQRLHKRTLATGVFVTTDSVRYIDIEGKALLLLGKVYQYNADTDSLDEHDLADEELDIIGVESSSIIRFEKNNYVCKQKFDCIKETDQQDMTHQPISNLVSGTSYLTLKTHNFPFAIDIDTRPQKGDILQYMGCFWMVEETYATYMYTPRERMVLHIAIKMIKK